MAMSRFSAQKNPEGAIIGALKVDDPNAGDSHTYTISDDRFEIDSGNLRLEPGVSLNHESQESLRLTVTEMDSEGQSISRELTLIVSDQDEAPVIFGDMSGSATKDSQLLTSCILSPVNENTGESDPEIGFQAQMLSGQYSSLSIDETGAWRHGLDDDIAQPLSAEKSFPRMSSREDCTEGDAYDLEDVNASIARGMAEIMAYERGEIELPDIDEVFNELRNEV